MSDRWQTRPLSELVDPTRGICYGVVQPGEDCSDGVPLVRVNDIRDGRVSTTAPLRIRSEIEEKYARSRLRGGELLLTLVGTVGETAIASNELAGWNTARAVGVLPILKEPGARWVCYMLRTPKLQSLLREWCNTTVQATLNLRDVARLPIAIPSQREREAIEGILSAFEDKMRLHRQTNETLESMIRALFKSWFFDFNPIRRGKAAGMETAVFSTALKEHGTGAIPQGWRRGTFGDIAEAPRRGVHPSEVDPHMAYIGLEHMPRRSIALAGWGKATDVTSGKLKFSRKEILFGKLRPYFHKVGVAPIDGVCSTDILVITPRKPDLFGLVLCYAFSDTMIKHADATSAGTKMPRTNWMDISRFEVVLPPDPTIRAFNRIIDSLVEQMLANVHEDRQLTEIRDLLLPRLLSGELRVRDAEHIVGAAV